MIIRVSFLKSSISLAIECLGAKGRFGRDACEYFDANGACKKKSKQVPYLVVEESMNRGEGE